MPPVNEERFNPMQTTRVIKSSISTADWPEVMRSFWLVGLQDLTPLRHTYPRLLTWKFVIQRGWLSTVAIE